MTEGINWGDVATWAAAFIALVSAFVTVWWPHRNRAQASWFVIDYDDVDSGLHANGLSLWTPHNGRGTPDKLLRVLNDGDGPGFNVVFTVEEGEAAAASVDDNGANTVVTELPTVHVIQPGESVPVAVWFDSDDAALVIHWTLQPTRLDKHVYHRIALRGKIDRQPWKPLAEPEHDRGCNLTLYRLAHFHETQLAHRLARWKRNLISALKRRR